MEIMEADCTGPLIGAMTRAISLLLAVLSALGMSACSTLTRMQYHAPSHQNAVPEDRFDMDGLRLSGPPVTQRIDIGSAKLVAGNSSDLIAKGQKTYSFGPMWLPVIPTLFNWFIPYKRIGVDIAVGLVFRDIKDDIEWDPHKSFVAVSEGSPIFPSRIEGQDRKIVEQGEILKIRKSWTSWSVDLQFPLPNTTSEFTVFIKGLSSDGKEIPEIPIAFKYSKGWVLSLIP